MGVTTFVAVTHAVPSSPAAIDSLSPVTDSPIRIVSIKPAGRRGHRRMPMPAARPSADPSASDPVVHIGRYNVLAANADAAQPIRPSITATSSSATSATDSPSVPAVVKQHSVDKSVNQPENLFTSKSLQGGAWLQVVPGKYPVYYAVARANGLFQEHSIRAYPAKRGFVFKH